MKAEIKSFLDIEDIFEQGDRRYTDPKIANVIYNFIKDNAIIIIQTDLSNIELPKEIPESIYGPQEHIKHLALNILKKEGAKVIGFERRIPGGRADILAERNGKTIALECGPCRTDKAIKYLENENTELWIVTSYLNESSLTKVTRGPNWSKAIKQYTDNIVEQLEKIKSPMDDL